MVVSASVFSEALTGNAGEGWDSEERRRCGCEEGGEMDGEAGRIEMVGQVGWGVCKRQTGQTGA